MLGYGRLIVVGLTATIAVGLLVPFTYTMDPAMGLMLLGGLYAGATYGGPIPAILPNTPGMPAAVATAIEGYPMSRAGRAPLALKTLVIASFGRIKQKAEQMPKGIGKFMGLGAGTGTLIGILPGEGAAIAGFSFFNIPKRIWKTIAKVMWVIIIALLVPPLYSYWEHMHKTGKTAQ